MRFYFTLRALRALAVRAALFLLFSILCSDEASPAVLSGEMGMEMLKHCDKRGSANPQGRSSAHSRVATVLITRRFLCKSPIVRPLSVTDLPGYSRDSIPHLAGLKTYDIAYSMTNPTRPPKQSPLLLL